MNDYIQPHFAFLPQAAQLTSLRTNALLEIPLDFSSYVYPSLSGSFCYELNGSVSNVNRLILHTRCYPQVTDSHRHRLFVYLILKKPTKKTHRSVY